MNLAIDIGGTSIKIGLFDDLEADSRLEFEKIKLVNKFDEDIKNIREILSRWEVIDKIKAIGIGIPGTLNPEETALISAANVNGWVQQDIIGTFKREFGVEDVFICNDGKAAAISEIDNKTSDYAFIVWGTGVGCTIVRNMKNKPTFQQVKIGYQTISNHLDYKKDSSLGYLEHYCGGGYLESRFGKEPVMLTEEEWDIVIEDMSFGITNLLMLNYVGDIVFSGGVAIKQSKRLHKLFEYIDQKKRSLVLPSYSLSKYGEDAGLVGALGLIKLRQSAF